jgi:RNA polymerase sigma factor (sigma-70 family)
MQMTDDMDLLRDYALRHSEEAFATLVRRHIDLVYSAALRHVGNHHQAEEITQAVFVILARKAASLRAGTILPGWLFRTTRLTAANYLRAEIRRVRREQEACMQLEPSENTEMLWQEVAPILNDAIADLRESDRNAIVLRFLKGKDYKEVAMAMGGTEEAAQMRVSRALEKLRKLFVKRGVVLSAAVLGGLMTAHAIQPVPLGLAASVANAAIHGTTLTASTLTLVKGTLKLMAWTKAKFAVGATVVVVVAYQYHHNSVQAQQLAIARENLRVGTEALTAQTNRLTELEQETSAILETRREQEQELAQLRARRRGPANEAQAQPGVAAPTTLLSATLQDPIARQTLRDDLVNNYRGRWDPLIKELHLDEQTTDKLVQIGGDWSMKELDAVAAFTDGKISAAAAIQIADQADLDGTNQVRLLLGETGLVKYEECERSYPARSLVEQFDKQLGFFAIHELQRQRLYDVIAAQPLEVAKGLAGSFTVQELVSPEELNHRFEQQSEANQQILRNAAAFLELEQWSALGLMQKHNMSTQKRNVLRMLRRL